jgi:hypothetical protein
VTDGEPSHTNPETYRELGLLVRCPGLPAGAPVILPDSGRYDNRPPSSARPEPRAGWWRCVEADCSCLASPSSSSPERRAGSHKPMSDGLRRDGSLALLLAASRKMLSGLRSPTNREVDSSMSWEATSRADDAPELGSARDPGDSGSAGPGRFEPPGPPG